MHQRNLRWSFLHSIGGSMVIKSVIDSRFKKNMLGIVGGTCNSSETDCIKASRLLFVVILSLALSRFTKF